ncbi:trehalose-phosphatase [Jannaschia rubra]|uniref:Trehalose 6-phosphate phosphatase n=1 Tax=Jannaschia rubra TaxID=282197 RepID=A0A0M6XMV8_9RHOB|nr:trehalose-phosphatase [Jannaschia rubra]CTQ31455.1 Trehalose-6-phosphate phosphatase [Jannaschia rubra]SFF79150.1 trehalose 6-phosphatase [Jannaschia rubra]
MLFYQLTGFMGASEDDTIACKAPHLPDPSTASLLLDFDGTLVEIADRPDGIVVTDKVRYLLRHASERLEGRIALVSGRSIEDLQRFLPDFDGPLIGTHGAEMRIDGERTETEKIDHSTVSRLIRLAEDFGALRPEFLVERKPSGVVLHYRQAEDHAALALRFMESLAMAADGFRLQPALMAYELKPENIGKDVALRKLLAMPPFAGTTPVFIGDDLTDEPALDLVQEMGGFGIKIGEAETVARHRLADPSGLIGCLEEWLG